MKTLPPPGPMKIIFQANSVRVIQGEAHYLPLPRYWQYHMALMSYLPYGPRTQQQLLSNWAGPNLLIDGEKMLRDPLHWPLSDYKVPVRFKTPDGPNKDGRPLQWSYCDQDAHWQTEVLSLPSTSSEEWAVDSTWSHCVLLSRASGRVLRRIDSDQFTSLNQTMYYHHPVSCDWFCQKKICCRDLFAQIQN